jgi:hypothetical protein
MSEAVDGGNGAAPDEGAGPAVASAGTGSGDTRPPAAGSAPAEKSEGSEAVDGGNRAAPDEGAGPAVASAGTGSGDTRPPAAGSAPAEKSEGSEAVDGGNGAAPDEGAGPAVASAGTGSGGTRPPAASRASKVTSYFLSSVKWVGKFISENPELINNAAIALAEREDQLNEKEAKQKIESCLTDIQNLARPLIEPAEERLSEHTGQNASRPIERARRFSATQLYLINRSTELEGHYIRIRTELLESVTNNPDRATDKYALSAAESLQLAYGPLVKRARLNAVANYLSQADAFTASTLTKTQAAARANTLLAFLNSDTADEDDHALRVSLKGIVDKRDKLSEEAVKGTLVAVIRRQWAASCSAYLAEDLQESRMKSILIWLIATLIGLIGVVPLVVGLLARSGAGNATFVWPMLKSAGTFGQSYIAVGAIALIGCVGGTLSALLAARDSRTSLETYRTDMQRALMKPIMGAVLAVLVYALLTWQVIPGVKITNAGTYLLFALLAGFSERFFLRLLPLEGPSLDDGVAHRDRSAKVV